MLARIAFTLWLVLQQISFVQFVLGKCLAQRLLRWTWRPLENHDEVSSPLSYGLSFGLVKALHGLIALRLQQLAGPLPIRGRRANLRSPAWNEKGEGPIMYI